jgi:RNA polymerase sigma-70 factor (ECF subfamily)
MDRTAVGETDASALDELAGRVRRGDRAAFVELFRACHREVRLFISAHAPSVDVVEEVLQAAFVTCFEQIGRYEPRGTFLSWLKGIARFTLLKELRARARYAAASGDDLDGALTGRSLESLESLESADAGDESEERVARLRKCLDRLPAEQRALVDRRYADGVPPDRLAQLVGRTENWVAVNLFRIRRALQACIERAEGRA